MSHKPLIKLVISPIARPAGRWRGATGAIILSKTHQSGERVGRFDKLFRDDVAGVRAAVVGHTPVERFTSLRNVHYIDTAAWKGGNANPAPFPLLDAHTLRPADPPSALRW